MASPSIPEYRGEFTFGARMETSAAGALYKGQLAASGRVLVIEVLDPPFDAELETRLLAEARLRHENIWAIVSLLRGEGQIFLLREPLEGAQPLPEYLRSQARDLAARLKLMRQVASALAAAHAGWVVHRNLTPARIFVLPDGGVRVADFSIDAAPPRGPVADVRRNLVEFAALFQHVIGEDQQWGPLLHDLDPQGCQSFDQVAGRIENGLRQMEEFAALVDKGRALLEAGQFAEAIPVLHSAARLGPLDSDLLDRALRGLRGGAPQSAGRWDENVQFTVYRPQAIRPGEWKTLLAFAHLAENPPDAPASAPDPLEEVKRRAAAMLGAEAQQYRDARQDASVPIPAEGELTFVPQMEGMEFNPPRVSFLWQESVHEANFRMRALPHLDGSMARGQMCVYLGSIVVAQIALRIEVNSALPPRAAQEPMQPASASRYRKIFASYSHRDAGVVQEFERYGRAMGDQYLRDVIDLRSGEVWNDRLLQMIDQADVFQLFWSSNSMHSTYVQREWLYALSLKRDSFVRPVYWEDPLPEDPGLPPQDLRALHFHRVFPGVSSTPSASGTYAVPPKTMLYSPPPVAAVPVSPPNAVAPSAPPPRSPGAPQRRSNTQIYRLASIAAMVVLIAGVGLFGLRSLREPVTTAQNQPAPVIAPPNPPQPAVRPAPNPTPAVRPAPPVRTQPRPAPRPEPTGTATPTGIEPPAPAANYRLVVWSRGSAIREGQVIIGGDPQLQCFVLGAANASADIQVRWYVNERLADTMTFQGPEVAKAYRRPIIAGRYRAVLNVNGEELASLGFSIEGRPSAVN